MAELTLNIGLKSPNGADASVRRLGGAEAIHGAEALVQLCTHEDTFDGEWKWDKGGMAYMLRTRGNRLCIIDGGRNVEDSRHIIEKARELTGEQTPVVALWILTHPHVDHYNALLYLSRDEQMRSALRIERLCFDLASMGGGQVRTEVLEIAENLKESTEVLTPRTGNVWDIDGMTLRFFFTPTDFDRLQDGNEYSLIFRVCAKNKSVMFTGDTYPRISSRVVLKFWDELKSDICQLAHHGLNGADASFYARVDANTVLIPICIAGDKAMNRPIAGILPRFYAEQNAQTVIKPYQGDTLLNL